MNTNKKIEVFNVGVGWQYWTKSKVSGWNYRGRVNIKHWFKRGN